MDLKETFEKIKNQKLLILPAKYLNEILDNVEIIDDKDTLMSDHIRIIKLNNDIYVQELTAKNELALRVFDSLEKANEFVNARMETYEKMWDGCGCKVNYYD